MSRRTTSVNRQTVIWQQDTQQWAVIDSDGRVLGTFADKYEATLFASQNRSRSADLRARATASRRSRRRDEDDTLLSFMYGIFLLVGMPAWMAAVIVTTVLIAVIVFGIPLVIRVFGGNPVTTTTGVTIADISNVIALGLLAVIALGTLLGVILGRLMGLSERLQTYLLSPLYITTWIGLRLGIVLGAVSIVLGVFNLLGFGFWGAVIFASLWLLAVYALNRILWNMILDIIEGGAEG